MLTFQKSICLCCFSEKLFDTFNCMESQLAEKLVQLGLFIHFFWNPVVLETLFVLNEALLLIRYDPVQIDPLVSLIMR